MSGSCAVKWTGGLRPHRLVAVAAAAGCGGDRVAGLAVALQAVGGHLADVELRRLLGVAAPAAALGLRGGPPRAALVGRLRVALLQQQTAVPSIGSLHLLGDAPGFDSRVEQPHGPGRLLAAA